MPLIACLLILSSLHQVAAYACDEDTACADCGEKPEFSWNPPDQYVTSNLRRFYDLKALIDSAFDAGDYGRTRDLAQQYLELASVYRCNWNYGNAIHESNRILGLIALEYDDNAGAANYLIKAGQSTGSPQLDSFGPELDLANELLSRGESKAVLQYLLGVKEFWEGHEALIDGWIQKIYQGEHVQLTPYQPDPIGRVVLGLLLAWPPVQTFVFWLKIKSQLSNNWSFPITAVLTGFSAMLLGGMLLKPLLINLAGIVSADMLGPIIVSTSTIVQLGCPLLAIYLVARLFKKSSVPDG